MSKHALIVSGGWDGHQPKETCELFAGLLREAGLEVTVSGTLDAYLDSAVMLKSDLIVNCWTMGELPKEHTEALTKAVAAGKGFAGWHGGMGDAFRGNLTYEWMVGGHFLAHPGNVHEYAVYLRDQIHPITEGIEPVFRVDSEQYYMLIDPAVQVLAVTFITGEHREDVAGTTMPVAWVRRWERGRVFFNALGHQLSDFDVPPVRELTRRGLLWAANAL